MQDLLKIDLQEVDDIINETVKNREEIIPIISEYIFASGGKRLRPMLVLLTAILFDYQGIFS